MPQMNKRSGAETLRLIVKNIDYQREDFNDRFTVEELVKLGKAHLDSEWDYFPDQWTERQIKEALDGITPKWDAHGQPVIQTFRELNAVGKEETFVKERV